MLRDMQEEFQDGDAVLGEMALKRIDLLITRFNSFR
jgi:hypothetical protein